MRFRSRTQSHFLAVESAVFDVMARMVALLRGMNLGKRRLTNEALCAAFVELGARDVSAFLASGNVVFTSPRRKNLSRAVATGLEAQLGYPVEPFLRSPEELARIVDPFDNTAGRGKLQVGFFASSVSAERRRAVLAHATEDDWLALDDRELYWSPAGGVSESELDIPALEKLLGTMTIRTFNTIVRLRTKYFASTQEKFR